MPRTKAKILSRRARRMPKLSKKDAKVEQEGCQSRSRRMPKQSKKDAEAEQAWVSLWVVLNGFESAFNSGTKFYISHTLYVRLQGRTAAVKRQRCPIVVAATLISYYIVRNQKSKNCKLQEEKSYAYFPTNWIQPQWLIWHTVVFVFVHFYDDVESIPGLSLAKYSSVYVCSVACTISSPLPVYPVF